jgi:NAD(P)-dependent dehydrogenase (short-subunit alcohol dehydrogenase family)
MTQVWFLTGSSRGLGRSIAEAVLAHGDKLVATARRVEQLDDLSARYGAQVKVVELDVADAAAAGRAVQTAIDTFGRLDVVVNNAGYGTVAAFEDTSEADFRAQIDTNFYGVVNVTRAILPILRQQGAGHIIQISSVGGRIGTPGLAAYQAAKWAVGGFSEALATEITPVGIKLTVVEPGGMKTNWAATALSGTAKVSPAYAGSVGMIVDLIVKHTDMLASDPDKVAQVIVKLANYPKPPLHLLVGSDAVHYAGIMESGRRDSDAAWREVSISTDFSATGPIPAFP